MMYWIKRIFFPGWLLLLCCSCAGSLETARAHPKLGASPATAERCNALSDRHTFFGGASKTLAVIGGGEALSVIPVEDDNVEMGLAIGSAAAAALAVGAQYVSDESATSWARECGSR